MPNFSFRPAILRFVRSAKSVHVVADCNGRQISVLISKRVIEYLAETTDLDQDQSFTTVVRNKEILESAARRTLERYGDGVSAIAVELADVKLWGSKAPPRVLRAEVKRGSPDV
jgi:hypothetical protein